MLLQGCRDVGPEGEEGEDLGEQPAPGWGFKDTTSGAEQPGQQPRRNPQRKFVTLFLLDMW